MQMYFTFLLLLQRRGHINVLVDFDLNFSSGQLFESGIFSPRRRGGGGTPYQVIRPRRQRLHQLAVWSTPEALLTRDERETEVGCR